MAEYMYEGMFLLDSNKYATDPEGVTKDVLGMLTRVNAELVASRPWKEDKLCYPIKGHRKGLYFLTCFKVEGGNIQELERVTKLSDVLLRAMFIRHEQTVFTALVDAMNQADGAIHSPEQKGEDEGGERGGRGDRGDRGDRGGRGRRDRDSDDSYSR